MIHRHQPDRGRYPQSLYDDDFCLKPPSLLWLMLAFLSRGALLPLLAGLGHYANVNTDAMALMRGLWRPDQLVPALLAVPVLYSLIRRTPRAAPPVRWIWRHGRLLLAAAAASDIALAFYSLKPYDDFGDEAFVTFGACAADVYFLLYLGFARRIRDTFADFPPPRSA
jgi:hypothetical protein